MQPLFLNLTSMACSAPSENSSAEQPMSAVKSAFTRPLSATMSIVFTLGERTKPRKPPLASVVSLGKEGVPSILDEETLRDRLDRAIGGRRTKSRIIAPSFLDRSKKVIVVVVAAAVAAAAPTRDCTLTCPDHEKELEELFWAASNTCQKSTVRRAQKHQCVDISAHSRLLKYVDCSRGCVIAAKIFCCIQL